jgi:hypothetical protein
MNCVLVTLDRCNTQGRLHNLDAKIASRRRERRYGLAEPVQK